eukprot:5802331-Pyramimonas_sp.AAC.1
MRNHDNQRATDHDHKPRATEPQTTEARITGQQRLGNHRRGPPRTHTFLICGARANLLRYKLGGLRRA